jgi:hypothetical protein
MNTKRKLTNDFFETHPVFSLEEAVRFLAPSGGKPGVIERLKYHLAAGRLKGLGRELYAVIPPGATAESVSPDPFLVAAAARPGGVFAYHSALELLGAAHSSWTAHTLFVESRRRPVVLKGTTIKFLVHPKPFLENNAQDLGTRKLERRGRWLLTTGPERTLVEGFRNPQYVGGPEELVISASGFPVLDLDLLFEILEIYAVRKLFAAVGWFLENNQKTFHVSDQILYDLEKHRPRSPQYVLRNQRSGTLLQRWNLVLPDELKNLGGPNDS